MRVEDFIARWAPSGAGERANFQQFAYELTQVLGVDPPKAATADGAHDDYRFERPVAFAPTSAQARGSIDLYRRGSFVMEAKQGKHADAKDDGQMALLPDLPAPTRTGHGVRGSRHWDRTMFLARNQADRYARAVARQDGWPPFLLVVDVGHVIEVYADFSGQGQGYTQFPDGARYRVTLDDLKRADIRDRLRAIWNDPLSLDPARISARVTREVADRLARLGRSFEAEGHDPQVAARFLMRCLFTMFAEDVDLIPRKSFSGLLAELRGSPEHVAPSLEALWQAMDSGGFSPVLRTTLKRFNGGLFRESTALPVNNVQLSLLIEAAERDWREVEPAIFGTLLERALDKRQRHKLGAHYTPRAYVERLVVPTVMEPLRADWRSVQAAALTLAAAGRMEEARATVRAFHRTLCEVRVLDPACGSGNFLYVALELMKRLEGEVTGLLSDLGEDQAALMLTGHTVDPHQFLGIEVNPWAAAVAELVLWIGYLQWHFRTHGKASPTEPVLRDFKNIECRDAVLDWDSRRERRDEAGELVTRWDGIGTVEHPATGERVPDPQARVQVWDYLRPRPAVWPQADFIVGNPPFIGKGVTIREALGDGYVEALRAAYKDLPNGIDFVMYWWAKAAALAVSKRSARAVRRFGFISTNSIRQAYNRRVVMSHLNDDRSPLSIAFAIPDHPWVDAADGAAVRISMTVGAKGNLPGRLVRVTEEGAEVSEAEGKSIKTITELGKIHGNLRIGTNLLDARPLKSNDRLASMGFAVGARGYIVSRAFADALSHSERNYVFELLSPGEIAKTKKNRFVIDLQEVSSDDILRASSPRLYQHLSDSVRPKRAENRDEKLKKFWWKFRRANNEYRGLIRGLPRYIATLETGKYWPFVFVERTTRVEHGIIAIGLHGAEHLAILSSGIHRIWGLAQDGTLEDRPRYNKTRCFDPFPFPVLNPSQKAHLRSLGEQLDAHRKAQQAAHPKLTLTGMYNVLEKLRTGARIEGKDRAIYDQGLIGILKTIHDDIDAAVAEAYGWPVDLPEDELLQRLVDLNRARAAEEARGLVRWLRPEYQNPTGAAVAAKGEQLEAALDIAAAPGKAPWPTKLPAQIAAVQAALETLGEADAETIARRFTRARRDTVGQLLESLAALGHARRGAKGRYVA